MTCEETKKKPAYKILAHETKRRVLFKFLLVVALFGAYFFFIAYKYGFEDGFLITALTWSFFVLCTPVADAGFLLDFPIRLILQFRMFHAELIVWGIAISLNLYTYFSFAELYKKTELLKLFHQILSEPFPFWVIILISAIGTFLSIQFGDELMDKVHHKDCEKAIKHKSKYRFILMVFLVVMAVILYDFLLKKLGVELPV
ncbi:hypothetical protein MNBD_NITROSPINAE01-1761 [hydrothermal vent metagenome]|uniref:Uncharacterized protein n=1 Tax=hydrothermal vent metagenome TaxID=652676 RepID=A0A3B1BWU7_9ZZZZ